MQNTLGLVVCNYLIPEVSFLFGKHQFSNVKLIGFPSVCTSGSVSYSILANQFSATGNSFSKTILLASNCHTHSKKDSLKYPGFEAIHLNQCFDIFLNSETVSFYIQQGLYIVSNGWLKQVDQAILSWGFNKEQARAFFKESLKGILWLDTGLPGNYYSEIEKLSDYMGLPYQVLPIGLQYCELYLLKILSNWQTEVFQQQSLNKLIEVSRQSADYALIFSQLESLVGFNTEKEIIHKLLELLNLLFAPGRLKYIYSNSSLKSEDLIFNPCFNQSENDNGSSFSIPVQYQTDTYGNFIIENIQFPEYLEQYKSIVPIISHVSGISVSNIRRFERIAEQNNEIQKYSTDLQKTTQAKDILYSVIAHDLRSPISTIISYSELLHNQKSRKDESLMNFVCNTVNSQAIYTLDLLDNLLQWTRSQSGTIRFIAETKNISEILQNLTEYFRSSAESKNISIIFNSSKPVNLQIDLNMINTVFRNLISNAIKFTYPGGIVSLGLEEDITHVYISIEDTGKGMDQKTINTLFIPAHVNSLPGTAKEKGSGLGLILCKDFIGRHGGEIQVESESGKGSRFTVILPKSDKKSDNIHFSDHD